MTPRVFEKLLTGGFASAEFEPFREGVEICHLHRLRAPDGVVVGPALALLRYRPGASVPWHEHVGTETIAVLAGSQSDDDGTYRQGDVVVNAAGSRHRVWSDEGCTVLISWAEPVRMLEGD